MLKFHEPTGAAFTSSGRIIAPANPSYTKNRSDHRAMIKAQESAEPFVTFDDSTSRPRTTAASVASYCLTIRGDRTGGGFAAIDVCLFDQKSGDDAVDDLQYWRQQFGMHGE